LEVNQKLEKLLNALNVNIFGELNKKIISVVVDVKDILERRKNK